MAFLVFGLTSDRYHERTREFLRLLALQPTHKVLWFDVFVARFRLDSTSRELAGRPWRRT